MQYPSDKKPSFFYRSGKEKQEKPAKKCFTKLLSIVKLLS
jgi:hypothetical protein